MFYFYEYIFNYNINVINAQIFCASGVDLSGGNTRKGELNRTYSSPHVWICTATHPASRVTIIDANRPADVILSFEVCQSHLLCIAAVPGKHL